jgi:hypothetical protein
MAAAIVTVASGLAQATIYNPYSFTSLGGLDIANSSVTINTNTGQITAGGVTYQGVIDSQNGQAGINGAPSVAVFDFDSIDFESTDAITVVGSNGLALLSRGGTSISPAINISGTAGTNGVSGSVANAPGGAGVAGRFAGGQGGKPLLQYNRYDGTGIGSKPGSGPGGGETAGTSGQYNGDTGGGGAFGGTGGTGNGGENIDGALNSRGGTGGYAYGFSIPLAQCRLRRGRWKF